MSFEVGTLRKEYSHAQAVKVRVQVTKTQVMKLSTQPTPWRSTRLVKLSALDAARGTKRTLFPFGLSRRAGLSAKAIR